MALDLRLAAATHPPPVVFSRRLPFDGSSSMHVLDSLNSLSAGPSPNNGERRIAGQAASCQTTRPLIPFFTIEEANECCNHKLPRPKTLSARQPLSTFPEQDHSPLRNLETPPPAKCANGSSHRPFLHAALTSYGSISAQPDSCKLIPSRSLGAPLGHPSALLQPPAAPLQCPFTTPSTIAFRRLAHGTPPSARESHAANPLLRTPAC